MGDSRDPKLGASTDLRQANYSDVASILALERSEPLAAHWSENTYREIFAQVNPNCIAMVVEDEARLRGFLFARVAGQDCELENIVVAANWRRCGVAARLLESLIATARDQGAIRIFLEVRESNAAARAFYTNYSFSISGRRKSYYRHPDPSEDALRYSLPLL